MLAESNELAIPRRCPLPSMMTVFSKEVIVEAPDDVGDVGRILGSVSWTVCNKSQSQNPDPENPNPTKIHTLHIQIDAWVQAATAA
jgi:hypothetical protein